MPAGDRSQEHEMSVRIAASLPLVILLTIHSVSGKFDVTYGSSHICALQGSTVTMSCHFRFPFFFGKRAFWTKTNIKEINGEYPDLSVDPEYSQRLQYLGDKQRNCDLRLSHVTKKDEHQYYCIFTTNMDNIGIPGVSLSVTDLQVESPERVTEGDSVRLTCKSSCELTDTPTFIWYRNSQPLSEDNNKNELILSPVSRGDGGHYQCGVREHSHISPAAVYLDVIYPPGNPVISISASGEIVSGDSMTLSCSSDSNPPAEILWFKETKYIGSGGIFSISRITSDDSGEYKCKARNEHGEKYSDPVTLNVKYPPKSVSVSISGSAVIVSGDSVTLRCSSDSNPPAEIRWFKETKYIGSGGIFTISKINSDYSGEYNCEARNEHGEKDSDPLTLNVMYPPRNVSVSIADSAQIWFNSVSLSCISDSNPPALTFSWFKENQSSSVGSGQSFSAVQSGRFYCEAHNPHGSERSDAVTVTVHQGSGRNMIAIIVASGGLIIIIIIIITIIILFKIQKKRVNRTSVVNVYESDDPSANTYAALDHKSRSSDLYDTLSTVHHQIYENLEEGDQQTQRKSAHHR